MKFYNYKNGEIAFFENNEKMLISKEEKDMLVTGTVPFSGDVAYSPVYDYIENKINTSRYSQNAFSKVLCEFRKNTYTKESKSVNVKGTDYNVDIYKENNDPIAFRVNERTAIKGHSDFETAKSEFETLKLI